MNAILALRARATCPGSLSHTLRGLAQAYIFSNGQGTGVVHEDGTVGSYHQQNSYGPGVNWDVTYNY